MKAMPLIPYKYLFSLTKRYDNDISKITPTLIADIPYQYRHHSQQQLISRYHILQLSSQVNHNLDCCQITFVHQPVKETSRCFHP